MVLLMMEMELDMYLEHSSATQSFVSLVNILLRMEMEAYRYVQLTAWRRKFANKKATCMIRP
jgi:hypothetical protein